MRPPLVFAICHWLLNKMIHFVLILLSTIDHSSWFYLLCEDKTSLRSKVMSKAKQFAFLIQKLPHKWEFLN